MNSCSIRIFNASLSNDIHLVKNFKASKEGFCCKCDYCNSALIVERIVKQNKETSEVEELNGLDKPTIGIDALTILNEIDINITYIADHAMRLRLASQSQVFRDLLLSQLSAPPILLAFLSF